MDEQGRIFSQFELTPRQHTRALPNMMTAVLEQSGLKQSRLTHIAYANGPGAFTGIRIATASAQGLGIGLGIPLVPISTLAVLAQQALDEQGGDEVVVALDARMNEAYTAFYRKQDSGELVECVGIEELVKLDQLTSKASVLAAGSGFRAQREEAGIQQTDSPVFEDVYPTAHALVKLAQAAIIDQQWVTADQASINYLRNNVAQKKKTNHV